MIFIIRAGKFVYVGILFVRLFCTSDYEIKFYILKRKNEWMAFESMHGDIFFFFSKFRKVLSFFFFFFLLIDNKYIIPFEGNKREILKLEFCWEILSMDENLVFLTYRWLLFNQGSFSRWNIHQQLTISSLHILSRMDPLKDSFYYLIRQSYTHHLLSWIFLWGFKYLS